jgi:hypothetical protein
MEELKNELPFPPKKEASCFGATNGEECFRWTVAEDFEDFSAGANIY